MGEPLEFCQEIDQIRMEADKAEAVKAASGANGMDVSMADHRMLVSTGSLRSRRIYHKISLLKSLFKPICSSIINFAGNVGAFICANKKQLAIFK